MSVKGGKLLYKGN